MVSDASSRVKSLCSSKGEDRTCLALTDLERKMVDSLQVFTSHARGEDSTCIAFADMERNVVDSLFRYIRWVTVKGIRQFLGGSCARN